MKKIIFALFMILILAGCSNNSKKGVNIEKVVVTPEDIDTSILLNDATSVKLFLDNGFPINYRDNSGYTLFIKAVRGNSLDVIKLLVERGADIEETTFIKNRENTNIKVPEKTALYYAKSIEVLRELIKSGANIDYINSDGEPLIINFIKYQPQEYIKLIISSGADINFSDKNTWTPLMWAAVNSQEEIVKELITAGADIFYKDSQNNYALYYVFDKAVLSLLLKDGYDMSHQNKDGENVIGEVFLKCVANSYYEEVEKLLQLGVDINYSSYGESALFLAKENKDAKMITLLEKMGAI